MNLYNKSMPTKELKHLTHTTETKIVASRMLPIG